MNSSPSNNDSISARDVLRQLPFVAKKIPRLVKGYYYYALLSATKPITMADIVARNADQYAQSPAIYYQDFTLDYAQLNAWANQYAHYFRAAGIGRGDTIALNLENRPEIFPVLIGAHKLGAAVAMINTSQKGHVLAHSINLIKPKVIVIGEEQIDNFESARSDIAADSLQNLLAIPDQITYRQDTSTVKLQADYRNLAEAVRGYPEENPHLDDPPQAGDVAVYLFTSGTTGLPKAAPSSHRKWFKAFGGFGHMSLGMSPQDVMYVTLPLYHGTGLLVCWGAVLAGASAIALRRKFSASEFWKDARHYGATSFGYVGELCRYLVSQPEQPEDRNHSVRKMVGNGLRPSIWEEFKRRFGVEQVAEFYGASEGNVGFSNFLNLDNTVGFSTAPFALVKFHEGTRDPIRSAEGHLEKVTKGEPGLLLGKITNKWNFEGYSQSDATEKAIIRNAFKKGDAWFNSGDVLREIGFRHLQFVDRMGDTFRWKGENVSTTEVENLLDNCPGVEEAIVYGVEIPHTNGKAGMATLVPSDKETGINIDLLQSRLSNQMPSYAMPIFLRITDAIEKTGTFKYRKMDLKNASYKLGRDDDLVYVKLPGAKNYCLLNEALLQEIDSGKHRF